MNANPGWHVRTVFDDLKRNVNLIRTAVDRHAIRFYNFEEHPSEYQQISHEENSRSAPTQATVQEFLARKAFTLGFVTPETPCEVWVADPWDAEYLNVKTKEMSLAARILAANGLIKLDPEHTYARPTDKLLAEQGSAREKIPSTFHAQPALTLSNVPKADQIESDLIVALEQFCEVSVLMIDLDHFKEVNDSKGHPEGTKCLESVVKTIAGAVGRKGKIFRYGGDEFVVILPEFCRDEAVATAERIRREIESARPGGDISVTASIGICASNKSSPKSSEEMIIAADKAMYVSKQNGKNRVTTS
jgi:diguanylate cyclase (GGDEF)-like protein